MQIVFLSKDYFKKSLLILKILSRNQMAYNIANKTKFKIFIQKGLKFTNFLAIFLMKRKF